MVESIAPLNVHSHVSIEFLTQVVEFIFNRKSFIRDETLPEKILGALQMIDNSRLKELFDPICSGLQSCFENFDSYSQPIQSLALRLSTVALKITLSVLPFLRVLRYHELTTASKSAYVNVCTSLVALHPLEDTSWIPMQFMLHDVLTSNVYLRKEIGEFVSVAHRQNLDLFSLVLRLCDK